MSTLPSIFISHGSPMHALQAGAAGAAWAALGRTLPRPKALLVASAHWETDLPTLTGSPKPETIHDFYNFPEPLYQLRYPSPGAPQLAQRAQALLKAAGFDAAIDARRGLDHGAWAPLLYAYPAADVPVVQVSLQTPLGPRHHLELGRALASLADEDILIVGSGHMTHNLRELNWARQTSNDEPAEYVKQFRDWVHARIETRALDELAEYRARMPHGARAHPSEEHFLPLFFALGAAGRRYRAERVFDAIEGSVLAMDAYVLHPG